MGKIPWRRKWQSTPVFLPGKSHGQRSLAGYSPWGCKELDMTEQLTLSLPYIKGCIPYTSTLKLLLFSDFSCQRITVIGLLCKEELCCCYCCASEHSFKELNVLWQEMQDLTCHFHVPTPIAKFLLSALSEIPGKSNIAKT